MHPTLIDIGPVHIRSYGFMLAVSFLVGIWLAGRRARREGVDPQVVLDLSVYIILAAILGARLLYVAFHLEDFRNPFDVFALWQGGATFYGGMLAAMAVSWIYVSRQGLPFLQVADIVAPSIALGLAFTRVGCFLSGCCFGKPTTLPWGVTFPADCPAGAVSSLEAAARGVDHLALHPTQLYASAYGLVIFVLVLAVERHLHRRGATFGALLVLYGIARFTVDFFRYYEANARVLAGLTFNQVISAGLFSIGLLLLFRPRAARRVAAVGGGAPEPEAEAAVEPAKQAGDPR